MGGPAILVTNPAPVSRYLSGLSLRLDGVPVPSHAITLVNATPGETGVAIRAADLGPERGSYIRRHQTAEVRLPDPVPAGPHAVQLVLSLAGVTETALRRDGRVPVSAAGRGAWSGPCADRSTRRDLGITTAHEHLWMDSTPLLAVHGYATTTAGPWDAASAAEARWNPGAHPDNYRLTDVDAAVEELAPFVRAGGRTIVELTPPSLGRDPDGLLEIAELCRRARRARDRPVPRTRPRAVGRDLRASRSPSLARDRGRDRGDRDPPGIFGEIGTSDPSSDAEVGSCGPWRRRAASGLAISVHLHPWGHEGRTVLDAPGGRRRADRVILGHANTAIDRPDELRALADRGATLGFDLFGFDHSLLGPVVGRRRIAMSRGRRGLVRTATVTGSCSVRMSASGRGCGAGVAGDTPTCSSTSCR